ncbi:MAG: branched-chain amino acid ABC transporter substrate-binding protein [Alphaproteobacteria bacterium]|nr:branched-chain amino acid ABC transporter substrate-binding protein [Alphaproteobacteria bacterium]
MKRLASGLALAALVSAAGITQVAAQDIVVAIAGPLTGSEATFGEQMKRGAEQAVADINAKGGVLGRKLVLEVADDACDPKQAVAVANQLASKKAVFVAGHYCSSSSIPASEVYGEAGILQITPASTNPKFTDEAKFKNVFRVCGRDDQQGAVAGAFLADKYKGKKIAIIHDKTTYGKGLADETKKALNAKGTTEALYDSINKGDKDFNALVSKMKAAQIDAIYFGGYQTEAGLLVRQSREQGLQARLVSGDALVSAEFWSITGKAGEGTLMTFGPDPRKYPTAKAVVDAFKGKGYDPEGYTLYTYAAFQVFAKAAETAKSVKVEDLAKAMHAGKFDTVIGTLGFDAKGDVTSPAYVFFEWKDGKYAEM